MGEGSDLVIELLGPLQVHLGQRDGGEPAGSGWRLPVPADRLTGSMSVTLVRGDADDVAGPPPGRQVTEDQADDEHAGKCDPQGMVAVKKTN